MKFEELFLRYKSGDATPEERALVEEELSKARLIEEYLAGEFTIPEEIFTPDEAELNKVTKSIKKRTAKIITAAVALAVVIALIAGTAAGPAVRGFLNGFYPDPNKAAYGDYTTAFNISMTAYTELHHPGYIYSNAIAKNTGIGEYTISLGRYNTNMEMEFLTLTMDKGEITLPREFHLSELPVNSIARASYPQYYHFSTPFQVERTKSKLASLPDYIRVTAAVSFGRDITMEELEEFMESSPAQLTWAGIRNAPEDEQLLPFCGMDLNGSGYILDGVNDDYPCFEFSTTERDAEAMTQHFKSILKYTIDNPEFITGFMTQQQFDHYYNSVWDYVEENGVNCYGGLMTGTGEQMLELMDNELIVQLYIYEADIAI